MTPATAPHPLPKAASVQAPTAVQAMAGVLQRMGEVLGPGAIYSLVHYGAYEEGLALAAQDRPADAGQAVRAVAALLGLEAGAAGREGRLRVRVGLAPQVSLESRGTVALVVGLLEGMLTATHGSKVQAAGEPSLAKDGALEIEFDGGRA
ncbi:MAG: hypothetical protein LC623_01390 [Halobacteriales archaeon]|nr:hypothetical protein [Halobacteriales archaeon]